jgi:hypothetical protein
VLGKAGRTIPRPAAFALFVKEELPVRVGRSE